MVAETGAIIDYILTTYGHGRLMPVIGTEARFHYTYWMHHAEGTAMMPLLLKLVAGAIRSRAPWLIKPVADRIATSIDVTLVTPNLNTNIDFWENTLARSSWFAGGEFSAADIIMSFPLEAAASRAGAGTRPHISAWLEKIHARPAYKKALARGGPYAYA